MSSLRFFLIVYTLVLLIGCGEAPPVKLVKEPHNIIVRYLDDLGCEDVSAYGYGVLKTLNIDALARFTGGYASSVTYTPGRYALLTGIYPWKNKDTVRYCSVDYPIQWQWIRIE